MPSSPQPLFESYRRFLELNFQHMSEELPVVLAYLASFPEELEAHPGYIAARGFLKSYAGNEATFNSYRTHVERLLLWSLLVARKPLLELRRSDAEAFMEFCLRPTATWIGPVVKSRFVRVGEKQKNNTDSYQLNPAWRPFSLTVPKREKYLPEPAPIESRYKMAQGSVAQVFAVCGSFYQYAMDEGLTEANPFRAVKQKAVYKQRHTQEVSGRALSHLQWDYVLETSEQMAEEDPDHERTLFVLATLFAMYLRVSDLVGRDNWEPTMGDFRRDTMATGGSMWWARVTSRPKSAYAMTICTLIWRVIAGTWG